MESTDAVIREVVVTNSQGLHLRPADRLVKAATLFQSKVELIKDGDVVDAKSILSVMTLGAVQGTGLTLRITGEDAEKAASTLVELFANGFEAEGPDDGASVEQPSQGAE